VSCTDCMRMYFFKTIHLFRWFSFLIKVVATQLSFQYFLLLSQRQSRVAEFCQDDSYLFQFHYSFIVHRIKDALDYNQ
jgi:hypothetical protein